MRQLSNCPVCNGNKFAHYLSAEDYTVSHETFELQLCTDCRFVMTNPRPEDNALASYYESPAYISHNNRGATLLDQLYKISRYFTLRWKHRIVQKNSSTPVTSILDFGCGTGAFLQVCKKHNIAITGIEPAERPRAQALLHTGGPILADLSQLTAHFDAITAWHVMEHVSDIHETLRTLKARLAPQGTLFIAVPNHMSYDANSYRQYWAGYDVPRHLWHFTQQTLQRTIAQHQLNLVRTIPMKLDAYYVSLLSEKYRSQQHPITAIRRGLVTAWKSNRSARSTGEYSSLIYIIRK